MEEPLTPPQAAAPFERVGPREPSSPIVLSVPHAGRAYSSELLASSRLGRNQLENLEDRLVDRLIERALAGGAVAIIARSPRAEIDLNRDEREVDPTIIAPPPPARSIMPSARTRGGLGLIPARITGAGPIWNRPIQGDELWRRIVEIHRPYHRALTEAIDEARARFGVAVLLDCHSMPPRTTGNAQAEIVFGDLHGTTISADLRDTAVAIAQSAGYRTACNAPYAGGYITARHGRPSAGVHAMQIEICRSLYLAPNMRGEGEGFARIADMLAAVATAIAARAVEPPQAIAAE